MKKYRLLKDLPGLYIGDIFELVDSTKTSRLNDYYECCGIFADCGVVEDNPDWFEEIQEKEFTRDDMEQFAAYYSFKHNKPHIPGCLNEWINKKK